MAIPKITLGGRVAIHIVENREVEYFDYFKDIYSDSYMRITYKFTFKVQIRENNVKYYDVTLHKLNITVEKILNGYMHYTVKTIEFNFINREITVNGDIHIYMINMDRILSLMFNITQQILSHTKDKPAKLSIGYSLPRIWIK